MPKAGDIRRAKRSPWCEVRGSDIHGRGVFATRAIPKGTPIIEYVGEVISKREAEKRGQALFEESARTGGAAVYIFILNGRYDLDGNFPWNAARLINHSCDPNCETEIDEALRIWVVALRDIPAGEELFFDYNFDLENYQDHPCRCGSPACIGYIVGRDYWPTLKKRLGQNKRPSGKTKRPSTKKKSSRKS